jgi:hypothetical protein
LQWSKFVKPSLNLSSQDHQGNHRRHDRHALGTDHLMDIEAEFGWGYMCLGRKGGQRWCGSRHCWFSWSMEQSILRYWRSSMCGSFGVPRCRLICAGE